MVSIADNLWRSHFICLPRTFTVIMALGGLLLLLPPHRFPPRRHCRSHIVPLMMVTDKIFTNSSDNIIRIATSIGPAHVALSRSARISALASAGNGFI